MKIFLLVVWCASIAFVLSGWLKIKIEHYKISRMTPYNRMVYMTEKYGMNWQIYFDE